MPKEDTKHIEYIVLGKKYPFRRNSLNSIETI